MVHTTIGKRRGVVAISAPPSTGIMASITALNVQWKIYEAVKKSRTITCAGTIGGGKCSSINWKAVGVAAKYRRPPYISKKDRVIPNHRYICTICTKWSMISLFPSFLFLVTTTRLHDCQSVGTNLVHLLAIKKFLYKLSSAHKVWLPTLFVPIKWSFVLWAASSIRCPEVIKVAVAVCAKRRRHHDQCRLAWTLTANEKAFKHQCLSLMLTGARASKPWYYFHNIAVGILSGHHFTDTFSLIALASLIMYAKMLLAQQVTQMDAWVNSGHNCWWMVSWLKGSH